jgi:hypothetical protein
MVKKEWFMKKGIAVFTAVFVLSVSGLALAQMDDKGKGMMDGKGGMMGNGMMMKCMGMMQQMHSNMVATPDGGVIVSSGGKLIKYDNQLNVVKQVDLPKPEMGMMDKDRAKMDMDGDDDDKGSSTNKTDDDHASHHS